MTESKEFDGEKMSALHPVADSIFFVGKKSPIICTCKYMYKFSQITCPEPKHSHMHLVEAHGKSVTST